MSNNSNSDSDSKEFVIKFELPQLINTALTPVAEAIGETLSAGWKGIASSIEEWSGRKQIDKEINLRLYKENIENSISKIYEENLQEPSMNIIGPSLDASKYYFEDEQYREMFSKLIASSCDKSKNPYTHPAFVEFIKQMTPLEGKILKALNPNNLFLINIIAVSSGQRRSIGLFPPVSSISDATIYDMNTALNNLERLGLIELPNSSSVFFSDSEFEKEIKEKELYKQIDELIKRECNFEHEYMILHLNVTNLGINFIKVCIE